jgi:regulator of sigma E protease
MLLTLFYFILALLLLVTIHEFGHFLVARLFKVKVLRFSFGFGKILARWHDKKGTEYAWSLIPLGGYVKMLDEAEGEVPANERHLAFNNQSVWVRMAIIVAGPLFNFIFAIIAFWLVLIIGIQSLAPIIGEVVPGSIAAFAGLEPKQEILALNDKNIASWRDFQFALMPFLGSNTAINLTVKSMANGQKKQLILPLAQWKLDVKKPDPLGSLGIIPYVPAIPPVIGAILDNSPAQDADLKKEDIIKEINGKPLNNWLILVDYVRQHPDEQITLEINRHGQNKPLSLHIGSKFNNGQKIGYLGILSQKITWPSQLLRLQRERPLPAFATAFSQTAEITGATFSLMARFVAGKLPLQSISGPIGIAQGAGESARSGFTYYLSFLALISISLGVLNILPIPMLDGGHLLYCLIELACGRPLPDGVKSAGIYLGLLLLLGLMLLALSNDLSRLANWQ